MNLKLISKKKNHSHWHINQIYSLFKFEYPKRIEGKVENTSDKRRIFRKEAENIN